MFTQVLLIDEINRAPAKTQSALFEVMQEKQVTFDGNLYPMTLPFFVIATQNPVEQEGTYALPEAQLDRFTLKINVQLPGLEDEKAILNRFKNDFNTKQAAVVKKVAGKETIEKSMQVIEQIEVSEQVIDYISKLVVGTRNHPDIYLGGSPRASLNLLKCAKALAALKGRNFVIPDDVQNMVPSVLHHRLILNPEQEMAGVKVEDVVLEIINQVEVPR